MLQCTNLQCILPKLQLQNLKKNKLNNNNNLELLHTNIYGRINLS